MPNRPLADAPQIEVTSTADLREWLAANHTQTAGVWLVTFKKATPDKHVPTSDIVDQCLCFGWVDSLPRAKDAQRTMLYISPRKPGSNWSRVNKDKVARLIESGHMTQAGLSVIDRSKTDGSWTALDDVENLILPPDLAGAFKGTALANWEAFPRSVKRGALEILFNAKREATRQAKIRTIVDCASRNERPFQWRKT